MLSPRDITIESQGEQLVATVWQPDTSRDPAWRAPVIFVQSPYGRLYRAIGGPAATLVPFFVPKGYAVAIADSPGTGRSSGCFDFFGPREAAAAAAWIDYFALQKWSNGRIGMFGFSADGEIAEVVAVRRPAALRTIVTIESSTSVYDGYAYLDGVPFATEVIPSTARFVLLPSGLYSAAAYTLLSVSGESFHDQDCSLENLRQTSSDGTLTQWHRARDFKRHASDVAASVLMWTSFKDPVVLPINIPGWFDGLRSFHRGVFSQDPSHGYPWNAPADVRRSDALGMIWAWFDQELLDLPTGVRSWPAVQIQDESGAWRGASSMASASRSSSLFAAGDHLRKSRPLKREVQTFSEFHGRSWATTERDAPLHLSGQPMVRFAATLDRDDAHLIAILDEVRSDGSVRRLTEGAGSAPHLAGSLERPVPVRPGELYEYAIQMYPLDATVAAGSRLRLTLIGRDRRFVPVGNAYTATIDATRRHPLELILPIAAHSQG